MKLKGGDLIMSYIIELFFYVQTYNSVWIGFLTTESYTLQTCRAAVNSLGAVICSEFGQFLWSSLSKIFTVYWTLVQSSMILMHFDKKDKSKK